MRIRYRWSDIATAVFVTVAAFTLTLVFLSLA